MIIEGCECAGKTTLVKKLMEMGKRTSAYKPVEPYDYHGDSYDDLKADPAYHGHLHHDFLVPPKKIRDPFYLERYQMGVIRQHIDVLNATDNIIIEPFHLGEAVYGPLYRGYKPLYLRYFESLMHPKTVLVMLTATSKSIEERYDNTNPQKHYIKREDIPKIVKMFDREFEKSLIKIKVRIDNTDLTPEETFEEVVPYTMI
jgi:thymidylate kinase